MLISPGSQVTVYFSVTVGGIDTSTGGSASVYRNDILTSILATSTVAAIGLYAVTFTVPNDWVGYDQVFVRFAISFNGEITSCIKHAGTIAAAGLDDNLEFNIDRILGLTRSR